MALSTVGLVGVARAEKKITTAGAAKIRFIVTSHSRHKNKILLRRKTSFERPSNEKPNK